MSFLCGIECVVCLGCSRWAWKRCTYIGSYDSETWPTATPDDFQKVPHVCRLILAVYEDDLHNPRFPPFPHGYLLNPDYVVKRVSYRETDGHSPPYLIYADRQAQEVVLAIRGLNLAKETDYKLLMDNKLGMQMFDGGYVHFGLLKSAIWLLDRESDTIKGLVNEMGKDCKVVFAGHSLGSGVAALMTVVAVNHRDKVGGLPRNQIRGYAIAPARCMSLNLAVKYADVIHSIVLQEATLVFLLPLLYEPTRPASCYPESDLSIDGSVERSSFMVTSIDLSVFTHTVVPHYATDDFLPRTATPLEDIFRSIFCLPCLLFFICMRDTFIPEGRKLRDPRRLYAPGRMYHIVERKFCRCGRFPPEVRTAIPVEGRFEHIVLSMNATKDHGIIWIEREAEKALSRMKESTETLTPPAEQKMERMHTLKQEHKVALERAVSLKIPHAVALEVEDENVNRTDVTSTDNNEEGEGSGNQTGRSNWDSLVERLFVRTDSGKLIFRNDDIAEQ